MPRQKGPNGRKTGGTGQGGGVEVPKGPNDETLFHCLCPRFKTCHRHILDPRCFYYFYLLLA